MRLLQGFAISLIAIGGLLAFPPEQALGRGVELPLIRLAVFRPSTSDSEQSLWIVRRIDRKPIKFRFGEPGDLPAPANYRGDKHGHVQLAVFRPGTADRLAQWFIQGDDRSPREFGEPKDIPVPADYDGDGEAQLAVFRPSTAQWFIRNNTGAVSDAIPFGKPGDLPVPADYLGLGHAQLAVFRPSSREWFFEGDGGGERLLFRFGDPDAIDAIPVPADYLGLGYAQPAVFHPNTQEWLIRKRDGSAMLLNPKLGEPGDRPVPAAYRLPR